MVLKVSYFCKKKTESLAAHSLLWLLAPSLDLQLVVQLLTQAAPPYEISSYATAKQKFTAEPHIKRIINKNSAIVGF